MLHVAPIRKPRCFLVYAIAPDTLNAAQANAHFNEYVADASRGLVLWHDHFIGAPGGSAIFFVDTDAQREALQDAGPLSGWQVAIHPMVFSRSPSAFDEQIAFTLRAYRDADWAALQLEARPHYGDPRWEAETASES